MGITSYSMYYVPGLLQTGDYAREITRRIEPKWCPLYSAIGWRPGYVVSGCWKR
jgi:Domain of unknown function (DUF5753)